MAAPLFNLTGNLTILSDCDTTTGWSAGALEPDIKMQGTNSLAIAWRNGGTATFTPGAAQDMSAPDTHLRLWFQHSFSSFLETQALGGIRLFVSDGANTNTYYVGGRDTHSGAFQLLQANLATPDINGGANLAAITSCGLEIVHQSAARNVTNTWWDFFSFGTGYEIYGGTAGDKITWDSLAIADAANGYGIVQKLNGVYFLNAEVKIGDSAGANDCYFDGGSEVVVFYSANESSTLYKVKGTGNATGTTDIAIDGMVLKSASSPLQFDMTDANLTALSLTGSTLAKCSAINFKAGQTVTGNVFDSSGQVDPSTSTFQNNTIANSTDPNGALLWPTIDTNISNLTFNSAGTGNALYITAAGTKSLQNITFNGYDINGSVNAAVRNNSGSAVTLQYSGGTLPTYYNLTTSTTTVESSVTITFTGLPNPTDCWLYLGDPNNSSAATLEGNEAAVIDGTFAVTTTAGGQEAYAVFMNTSGLYKLVHFDPAGAGGLPSANADIPVSFSPDRVYAT